MKVISSATRRALMIAICTILVLFALSSVALADEATQAPSSTPFFQSLLIIVREGFEAILIISAIVAYLVKSGNQQKVRTVYFGAATALLASGLTAAAFRSLFSDAELLSQEVLEGVTMLLAVAVLFWVSYWLTGKVQARKWERYIEGKVRASLSTGNTLALAAAAFLAVYREGAETILFYQTLITGNPESVGPIALGFAVGILALVAIFLVFRYGSVRLPVKPFFVATSALLYYLAFVFAGQGVRELQEAGVIGSTPVKGVPVIEVLGIYPTWETLSLQTALVVAAVVGIGWQIVRTRGSRPVSKAVEAERRPAKA